MAALAGSAPRSISFAMRTVPAGPQRLGPHTMHQVRIHAGAPAAGRCDHMGRRVYVRGDIDVFPAGGVCTWHDDDPTTSLVIEVPPALISRAARALGGDPSRAALLPRHKLRDARIEHLAWALAAHGSDDPVDAVVADSVGLALVAHLLAERPAPPLGRLRLDARQLAHVTGVIEAQLDRPLLLAWLAAEIGISATHFKRLFRNTVGMPIHGYIIERRVERARALIAAGELSLAEVALAAGFAHQSHMARWLRRLLGTTPTRLRAERHRKSGQP